MCVCHFSRYYLYSSAREICCVNKVQISRFLLRCISESVCVLYLKTSIMISSLRMEKRRLTGPNCSMLATLRPWRNTTTNASYSATLTSFPWTTETHTNASVSQDTCLSPWTNSASGNPSLVFSSLYFGKWEFETAVIHQPYSFPYFSSSPVEIAAS